MKTLKIRPLRIYLWSFNVYYLALTFLRLLKLKVFNDELPIRQIGNFIHSYSITETLEGSFINSTIERKQAQYIKSHNLFDTSTLSSIAIFSKKCLNFNRY